MLLNPILINIVMMALWATPFTILGVMAVADFEGNDAFAPVNAISHIAFQDKSLGQTGPQPKFFLTGLLLNLSAMLGWAAVSEAIYRALHIPPHQILSTFVMAVAISVAAYFTDFRLVPERFTPGFEIVISRKGLYVVYALLTFALFVGGLQRI